MQTPTNALSLGRLGRVLATRRGTLALAATCSLIAAIVLMVFISRYRDSVSAQTAPTPVIVASALIQKGTSGDIIAEKQQFESVTRAAEDVKQGALADPAALAGKVAVKDIYPGQQITAGTFAAATGTVLPKLSGDDRAVAVPIDAAHGLVGQVQTGDHVDVLASYTTGNSGTGQGQGLVKTLLQDTLVLRAGAQPIEGGTEGKEAEKSIILRVGDREAVSLAHAADNGKIWVLLRPAGDAKESKPGTATMNSVIAGTGGRSPKFKATIRKRGDTVTVTGGPTP